jgi:hypothetical protein
VARRSLKPQLNQIRAWVQQGRTDAWIAHQIEVSVSELRSFKREHDLASADPGEPGADPFADDELDLRAEDDALVAAALEAEPEEEDGDEEEDGAGEEGAEDEDAPDAETAGRRRRRRGRRGGRGRRSGTGSGGGRGRGPGRGGKDLEGTFDHGDEGYGLWLDPSIQDDGVYAEHWAGHRPVTIAIEPDRIVIRRAGEDVEEDTADTADTGSEGEEPAAVTTAQDEAEPDEVPADDRLES